MSYIYAPKIILRLIFPPVYKIASQGYHTTDSSLSFQYCIFSIYCIILIRYNRAFISPILKKQDKNGLDSTSSSG